MQRSFTEEARGRSLHLSLIFKKVYLKIREGKWISQFTHQVHGRAEIRSKRSENRMTIHSTHYFTLTQKYAHFIRRVVLQVCLSPHLYLWAHTARCDCSPFHPHKLYHQEFLHIITANTVQMSYHQPTPTTSCLGGLASQTPSWRRVYTKSCQ